MAAFMSYVGQQVEAVKSLLDEELVYSPDSEIETLLDELVLQVHSMLEPSPVSLNNIIVDKHLRKSRIIIKRIQVENNQVFSSTPAINQQSITPITNQKKVQKPKKKSTGSAQNITVDTFADVSLSSNGNNQKRNIRSD